MTIRSNASGNSFKRAIESTRSVEETVNALRGMASFFELGDLDQVLIFGERALNTFLRRNNNDLESCLQIARVLLLVARSCFHKKKYDECLSHLNRAITSLRNCNSLADGRNDNAIKILVKDCIELGDANVSVSEAYLRAFNRREALPYCSKALVIYDKHFGLDSLEVAEVRRSLALIYQDRREFNRTLELNQLAVSVFKERARDSAGLLVVAEIEGANMLIELGRYAEAVDAMKGVVSCGGMEGWLQVKESLTMAKALCYWPDVDEYISKTHRMLEGIEIEDPTLVSKGFSDLSFLYQKRNDLETAISMMKRALDLPRLCQKLMVKFCESLESLISRFGREKEEVQEVLYMLDEVDKLKDTFGPEHCVVGYGYSSLGATYMKSGQTELVVMSLENAKNIFDITLGPHHLTSLKISHGLSIAHTELGRFAVGDVTSCANFSETDDIDDIVGFKDIPDSFDVLLYNFFGSSPMKNQWRVLYEFSQENDLLDNISPESFPRFDMSRHNIMCSELKQMYVAITRTRQRLWICEKNEDVSKPMFDYWRRLCLVQLRKVDESMTDAMQRASSPEEWKAQGIKLFWEKNYEMATTSFEKAGAEIWEKWAKARGLRATAYRLGDTNSADARVMLTGAAEIFESIGKADIAAECFCDIKEYERAVYISNNNDVEENGDYDPSEEEEEDEEFPGDEEDASDNEIFQPKPSISGVSDVDEEDDGKQVEQVIAYEVIPVFLTGQVNQVGSVTLKEGFALNSLAKDIQETMPRALYQVGNDTRLPHICWPWGVDYRVEYRCRIDNIINPLDMEWDLFARNLKSVVMTREDVGGEFITLRVNNNNDDRLTIPKRVVLSGYLVLHKVIFFYRAGYHKQDIRFINVPNNDPWPGADIEYYFGEEIANVVPGYQEFQEDLHPGDYLNSEEEVDSSSDEEVADQNDGGSDCESGVEEDDVVQVAEDAGEGEEAEEEDGVQVAEDDGEGEESDGEGEEAAGEGEEAADGGLEEWITFVERLSRIEVHDPHAA